MDCLLTYLSFRWQKVRSLRLLMHWEKPKILSKPWRYVQGMSLSIRITGRGRGKTAMSSQTSAQSEIRRGDERFGTSLRNILMEIKGSPMLRRPKHIETLSNFRNKNKYREDHEDFCQTTSECWELMKAHHEMADQGQLNRFLKQRNGAD